MKGYQLLDMRRIVDIVEGLFTKISYQEHQTTISVF